MKTKPLLIQRIDWSRIGEVVRFQQRNREKHTPVISVYRWWARRPHALVGAILDALMLDKKAHSTTVSDPFSGGGTVAVEAVKRGYKTYAQDLHPWAAYGLATILDGVGADELKSAARKLLRNMEDFRARQYRGRCPAHGPSETIHAFWVRKARCVGCQEPFYMFPYSLITIASRSRREREGYFGCSSCGSVIRLRVKGAQNRCARCRKSLQPPNVPNFTRRECICPHCGRNTPISALRMKGWQLCLVQRMCRRDSADFVHFDTPNSTDVKSKSRLPRESPLREQIPYGRETRILHTYGFCEWADLYPNRQLKCLLELARHARRLDVRPEVRDRFLLAIVGAAEMAGFLCRWDRYHPKAFEAVSNHRFSPTGLGTEVNLLGPRGRGTVPRRLAASTRATEWATRHFHRTTVPAKLAAAESKRRPRFPARPLIVVGSSERQLVPRRSVDLVVTDPPYFDSVQYGELSALFHTWSRAIGFRAGKVRIDVMKEAVPNKLRGIGALEYQSILERIFQEIARSLKLRGRILLTFRSTDFRAWHALGMALTAAGLRIAGLAVCHSENEKDHAKRGKHAFSKDLIIECKRGSNHTAPTIVTPPGDDESAELIAAGLAIAGCRGNQLKQVKENFRSLRGAIRQGRIS